jgi:hypothetical protein
MKKSIYVKLVIILMIFAGCKKGENGPTAPEVGTIIGKITDAFDQSPIANAVVSTVPYSNSDTTDANGNFSIENVKPGSYSVKVLKNGYNADSLTVSVTAGDNTNASIALSRSVSGKWEQSFTLSGTTFVGYYNLVQSGSKLSGDFVFIDGSGYTPISTSSSVNGKNINIIWYLSTYKLTFSGTIADDFNTMNGSMYLGNNVYACKWSAHKIIGTSKRTVSSHSLKESSKSLMNILSSSHSLY